MLCDLDGRPIPDRMQAMYDLLKQGPVRPDPRNRNETLVPIMQLHMMGVRIGKRWNSEGRTEYYLEEEA